MDEVIVNGVKKQQVMHSHYSKPMANAFITHKDSAMAAKTKENVLVADLTRVMRNISTLCTTEERRKKVQHYMNRMQYSGYKMEERVKVYRAAKRRYNKMVKRDMGGVEPLYQSKECNRMERMKIKRLKIL